ncbi:MAG: peptidylprolyl isomerase [Sulfuricurvum sp.]|uniref:peptidylprolyl isomerase n=1 Tax=Sulfuricurvum sp. TaxID=2025608 RepID=UPI00262924AF|nr:peptidylprolyl isomerase [Sulfuricurvum sp.]MDD2828047.1 peptidylprolyl isomerase [Sulfuricurvum sp.]MDD4948076.1 peptidylprolyl isomerase [Sulfuricurvum sp.]
MRSLVLSSLLLTSLWSAPIGGVAIMVKNSPITLYEVQQEMKQSKTSAQQSADTLIRKKLEQLEASEKKITVSAAEVQEELERMAKQNNLSMEQFLDAMQTARGVTQSELKTRVEESILGQKLYSTIAFSKIAQPTSAEEEEYYQLHLDEFSQPERYDVTTYLSNSAEALQAKIDDPMRNIENVVSKDDSIPSKNINPQFSQILNKIEVGKFGPILPNGKNGFMSFYMKDKPNIITESIDSLRPQLDNMIMGEKRNQVLNDYFTRLRLNADIQVVRLPE